MMIKKPIFNLHSDKPSPPRFCDVVVDKGNTYLAIKKDKKIERILWEDVVYQVNAANSENQAV